MCVSEAHRRYRFAENLKNNTIACCPRVSVSEAHRRYRLVENLKNNAIA
ncbi:hypothetical protein [Nostoc sp. 'Peltigera malacea cyanobiont' DB3992]|nr:hypothetical protein [Nostoc sp. 'Peltigera malacea cyanobiont' DB3992]